MPQVGHHSRPGSNHSPQASQWAPSNSGPESLSSEKLGIDWYSSTGPCEAVLWSHTQSWFATVTVQ